jgi:hypothetical protein
VKLVFDRLVGRLGATGWPAALVIRAATSSVMTPVRTRRFTSRSTVRAVLHDK